MKRFTLIATVAISLVVSPDAFATKPFFISLAPQPDFVLPDFCPFPVLVQQVEDREILRAFTDGRVTITGTAVRRFTNLATGGVVERTVSGTEFLTPNPDGTTTFRGEGLHMPGGGPGFLDPSSPGFLWITAGPVVVQLDANGFPIRIDRIGSRILHDLCGELA